MPRLGGQEEGVVSWKPPLLLLTYSARNMAFGSFGRPAFLALQLLKLRCLSDDK